MTHVINKSTESANLVLTDGQSCIATCFGDCRLRPSRQHGQPVVQLAIAPVLVLVVDLWLDSEYRSGVPKSVIGTPFRLRYTPENHTQDVDPEMIQFTKACLNEA